MSKSASDSVSEEIGRHFIVGLSGTRLTEEESSWLSAMKPLGVILRAHNFASHLPYQGWLDELSALRESVLALIPRSSMVFALDHEGGRVYRTPKPITHFPFAREYRHRAHEVATAMGVELRSIGINMSFSPVVDIDSNPKNPVIGARAFSSDPAEVAKAACEFSSGLLAEAIAPVAKHFPGHGDTSQDSHEELPTLLSSVESLKARELLPFHAIINSGIPALLSAHILFPHLDPDFPATLSPLVLYDLARESLGFDGVIISDDLDMKAISQNYSDEEVALRAPMAGCDILLFNHDPARAFRVARLVEQLLDSGQIDADLFAQSSSRIRTFLNTFAPLHTPHLLSEETLKKHGQLRASLIGG